MAPRGTLDLRPRKAKPRKAKARMPGARSLKREDPPFRLDSLKKDIPTLTGPVCMEVGWGIGEAIPT